MFREPADIGRSWCWHAGACTIGYSTLAIAFDDERIVGLADVRLAQGWSARR
jgi:hypothetical protein